MPAVRMPMPSGNPFLPCNETTDLNWAGISAMNALPFDIRKRPGMTSDEPRSDQPVDAAWIVLEAANDLATMPPSKSVGG
jgi:hypothetical protein